MEYNIIVAPNLELLATKVATFIPMGWRLKGEISELSEGFAQELERRPMDSSRMHKKQTKKQRRTKWIELSN
jgi:hypothetical protein